MNKTIPEIQYITFEHLTDHGTMQVEVEYIVIPATTSNPMNAEHRDELFDHYNILDLVCYDSEGNCYDINISDSEIIKVIEIQNLLWTGIDEDDNLFEGYFVGDY